MPSPKNFLPVYGSGHELLYHAPVASVPRLLASGLATAVGTKHRTRALLATRGATDVLRSMKPPAGQHYSHNHETADNPKGVWTFRKLHHDSQGSSSG